MDLSSSKSQKQRELEIFFPLFFSCFLFFKFTFVIFECHKRSIILCIELDILDTLSTRSLSVREIDLEHVRGKMLVEFDSSAASREHGDIMLAITVIVMSIARYRQRLDYDLCWQEHRLHVCVVLEQVRFSLVLCFQPLKVCENLVFDLI